MVREPTPREEVNAMVETYADHLIAQGQAEHARRIILRRGRKVFGEPDPFVEALLSAIKEVVRLDRMIDRLLDHSSDFDTWAEFLAAM
jgi:hypothetical protein